IKLERKIDKNIVKIGEISEFEINIKNNAEIENEVEFFDELPEQLEIISVSNALIKNTEIKNKFYKNTIYWKGTLSQNQEYKISYKVRFKDEIDYYSKAFIVYTYNNREKIDYSEQIRLYATKNFDLNCSFQILNLNSYNSKEDYYSFFLNQPLYFNISLKNNADKDINYNINVEIEIENELIKEIEKEYINKKIILNDLNSDFIKEDNKLNNNPIFKASKKINKNTSKNLDINFSVLELGNYSIKIYGNYTYDNTFYEIKEQRINFEIKDSEPEISLNINDLNENTFYSYEKKWFLLKIKNKNPFSSILIDDIYYSVNDDNNASIFETEYLKNFLRDNLNLKQNSKQEIKKNETYVLISKELIFPETNEEKRLKLFFNISYYNKEDNKKKSKTYEKTITLKPISKLSINPQIREYAYENEKINVKVNVNNPSNYEIKDANLNVLIPEFFNISGITLIDFFINKSQNKEILNFNLYPNLVNQESFFNITFILNYSLLENNTKKPYSIKEIKTIKIIPKIPLLNVKKIIPNSCFLGDIIEAEYLIETKDLVYNISYELQQNNFFDLIIDSKEINESIKIKRLLPNEKITIKGEKIVPKKTGKREVGKTKFFFYDEFNRKFNFTTSDLITEVKEKKVNYPLILVEKNIAEISNEELNISINFTNIGEKNAFGFVSDDYLNLKQDFLVPFFESKFLTRIIQINNNEFLLPKTEYYYDYNGKKIKAVSNELIYKKKDIKKENNEIDNKINEEDKENNKEENEETNNKNNKLKEQKENNNIKENEEKNQEKKESFFMKFMKWLGSLFYKTK
ncbi:MAG: hypothetical protein QXM96_04100, partial [Candidatus Woesearchaeota archaeon]